jgi:hypothetical protein
MQRPRRRVYRTSLCEVEVHLSETEMDEEFGK